MTSASQSGRIRCVLTGIVPVPHFSPAAALLFATGLCAEGNAALSLYVFPPAAAALASDVRFEDELAALHEMRTASEKPAARLVAQAGVSLVSEHAPVEGSAGDAEDRFLHLARTHDLTVMDAAPLAGSAERRRIEQILFDSGHPVLVVPQTMGWKVPQRIAIAWDGSARAARAVADALPLLAGAKHVFVVTITGEKDLSRMAPGADLATYLARHGISETRISMLARGDGDVAARLRQFVGEEAIELLVMGAFVHSRIRESVLGGVTRAMLDEAPVPLLLSH